MTRSPSLSRFVRSTACAVSLSLAFGAMAQTSQATLISTEQVAQEVAAQARSAAGDTQRARLATELDRPGLAERLQAYGVSAEQARERVAALSDEDAAALVAQIDEAPAGGDVLGVVVFVFVLLLVTDILGFTKIFPFTRSVR
ncbi:PA2779 family protein [Aquabacterium sp. A7-Y]|uniref:PA2779 family protein n=1 Tax=Aquabacterium sp. A7-Y TaxID=1349605 RepID=UPI00223DD861|nr:PA2779 family protein [Aquabacterium sp. A7-Y]MCW7537624.1 PA2779 family protein [Aquabacterium sp. A7-Y]